EAFLEEVKCAPEQVSVVYNAVDTDRLPAPPPVFSVRDELGLDRDAHVMTMVGTFKRQKGHEYLIMAAAKVRPRFPGLHVLLVGDGERRAEMTELAEELGLAGHLHFLGTRRDVPDILAVSDSFILPSLWEGLSLALMEAMASGLPVIATEVSGSRVAVVDGITGLLAQPGDADGLAQAIERMLTDTEGAKSMGRAGRARIEDSFSAAAQARHLVELFEGRSR
ncbi:MAG: glycosyltransferase, partial [Myxococcales bacterium]|nr:glycosyltransferase [Myxococcales bacterium]